MLDGLDAMLSIIQMPPGIPIATVGVNAAQNAAILAAEMIALGDEDRTARVTIELKPGTGFTSVAGATVSQNAIPR